MAPLHEIRTHADRITAIDSFTLLRSPTPTSNSTGYAAGHSSTRGNNGPTPQQPNATVHHGLAAATAAEASGGAGVHLNDRDASWPAHDHVAAGETQRRWDQGHGWGDGWAVAAEAASAEGTAVGSGWSGGGTGYGGYSGEEVDPSSDRGISASPATFTGDDDDEYCGRVDGSWAGVEMEREPGPEPQQIIEGIESKKELSASARAAIRRAAPTTTSPPAAARGATVLSRDSHRGGRLVGAAAGSSASAGAGGRGRGRGRGRGVDVEPAGRLYARRDRDAGGSGGGNGKLSPGEASGLGKRHGYAGRGQAEELAAGGGCSPSGFQGGGEEWGCLDRGQWGLAAHGKVATAAAATGRNEGWGEVHEADSREGEAEEEGTAKSVVVFTGSDDGTAKAWDAASGR